MTQRGREGGPAWSPLVARSRQSRPSGGSVSTQPFALLPNFGGPQPTVGFVTDLAADRTAHGKEKGPTVGRVSDEGTNPRWLLEGQDEVAVKTKVQNRSSSVNCLAPKILLLYRRSQGRITSPCFSDVWRSVGAGGAASPSLLSAVLVLSQHQ